MGELSMTEIEVPLDMQKIIMCPKHELSSNKLAPDMRNQTVTGMCKHCGKLMGTIPIPWFYKT